MSKKGAKKGGAKKGGKKGGKKEAEEDPLSPEDRILLLTTQVESLKNQLVFQKVRTSEAEAAMREFLHHYEMLEKV